MLLSSRTPSPKTRGGPDYGVGNSEALQHVLHLRLSPEVGQPGRGRGVGHGEVNYPADARPLSGLEQRPGVLGGEVEGDLTPSEPYPVGVVEDAGSLYTAAQPVRVREVQRGRLHRAAEEGVGLVRAARERPYADALRNQAPCDIAARVAEGAGNDGQIGVRHHVGLLVEAQP